jgi:very-short-patch-repair endonuclease
LSDLAEVLRRCESPIETRMALGFARVAELGLGQVCFRPNGDIPANIEDMHDLARYHGLWLHVFPQLRIGRYRADFFAMGVYHDIFPGRAPEIRQCGIVVECDGKNFHRNPKNHWRRDSYLTHGRGYTVMRFPGADIWRNAKGCADAVVVKACRLTDPPGSGWHSLIGPIAGPGGAQ